jgi:hypothetical protein
MRKLWLFIGFLSLVLAGCVVHHRRHHPGPPPGEPEPRPAEVRQPEPPPAEPAGEPEPPPRTHRAPPAPEQPAFTVRLDKATARRGENVEIAVQPFPSTATVFFNGRPLPKRTKGNMIVITVPGNATSGTVEVEIEGRRYGAPLNVVE